MKPFSAPFLEDSLSGNPLLGTILVGCSAGFLLFGMATTLDAYTPAEMVFQAMTKALQTR